MERRKQVSISVVKVWISKDLRRNMGYTRVVPVSGVQIIGLFKSVFPPDLDKQSK